MSDRIPTYRRKKTTTGVYAAVTLRDGPRGPRRDVLLGQYGTEASRTEYRRVLTEWESNGRRLTKKAGHDLTINEIAAAYWRYAKQRHQCRPGASRGETHALKSALHCLKELYGFTLAKDFGPLRLKTVRDKMVKNKGPAGRGLGRDDSSTPASAVSRPCLNGRPKTR